MTYNVFGGTLSLTQHQCFTQHLCFCLSIYMNIADHVFMKISREMCLWTKRFY